MKINKSIRDSYSDLSISYKKLKKRVDDYLSNSINDKWHYISRIKELESFALKIESGRYPSIETFDDFFACSIVVEKLSNIEEAEKLVKDRFVFIERKPVNINYTHKRPDSFPFDDLRLYVKWKDPHGIRPTGIDDLLFEVQIKTFLQHAWGIATHDLIYKTDEVNWSKERIAYQIKAMLEHAEVSILEAENLSKSSFLKKSNKDTNQICKIIKLLTEIWEKPNLPSNIKLLAIQIDSLLKKLSITEADLKEILINETVNNLGTKALNLSPFAIIIQSLFNQIPNKMFKSFKKCDKRYSLFVHSEIDIPKTIDISKLKGIVRYEEE